MPNHFELPLFIPVRPSVWFVAGFYTAHLGAGLALLTSNVPLVIQLLIITGLLASLIHGLSASFTGGVDIQGGDRLISSHVNPRYCRSGYFPASAGQAEIQK